MRKIVVGGIGLALGLSTVLATGSFAGGNGAQRSGLSPKTSDDNSDQCQAGSGAGTNGFVLVNAPGKPGAARFVNGEVSLKNDPAGATTYSVWLKDVDNDMCTMTGVLTTNAQGNGNSHIDTAGTSGTFFVVLQDSHMKEAFASAPVTAN